MQHSRPAPARLDRRRLGLVGAAIVAVIAVIVSFGSGGFFEDGLVPSWLSTSYVVLVYTGVGIMILWRRPGHGIGRLALAIGLTFSMSAVIEGSSVALLDLSVTRSLSPDVVRLIRDVPTLVGDAVRAIALVFGGILMVSWFPDGRAVGRAGTAVVLLLASSAALFASTFLRDPIAAQIGSSRALNDAFDGIGVVGVTCIVIALGVAVGDLLLRYRHADPVRRAQISWVLSAAGLTALLTAATIASIVIALEITGLWELWMASWLLPVLAIGIAVTRYHLYDIDRIVSQGIAYTIITVALLGVIAIGVLALPVVLTPQLGGDGLAVAASTLFAAILFQPLRTRVQRAVDRRFHRSRYDAERTVDGFAARLRDQLDLPTLTRDLRQTANDAVEPATTDVWLRAGAEAR